LNFNEQLFYKEKLKELESDLLVTFNDTLFDEINNVTADNTIWGDVADKIVSTLTEDYIKDRLCFETLNGISPKDINSGLTFETLHNALNATIKRLGYEPERYLQPVKINIPTEYLDKWLPKPDRDKLCEMFSYKAGSFLKDFTSVLKSSGYTVSFKKEYTNLYKISKRANSTVSEECIINDRYI
jgi:hypothetical protein